MKINGLTLPSSFVQDLQNGRFANSRSSWELLQDKDAYGNHLETELGAIFEDLEYIQEQTDVNPQGFTCISVEEIEENTKFLGVEPGEIPYFWDFSKIVSFAMSGDGANFCFDFREDEKEPSVIWWADTYWHKVAPNYETFIQLFDIPTPS